MEKVGDTRRATALTRSNPPPTEHRDAWISSDPSTRLLNLTRGPQPSPLEVGEADSLPPAVPAPLKVPP